MNVKRSTPLPEEERFRVMWDIRRMCRDLTDEAQFIAFPGDDATPDDDALRWLHKRVASVMRDTQARRIADSKEQL